MVKNNAQTQSSVENRRIQESISADSHQSKCLHRIVCRTNIFQMFQLNCKELLRIVQLRTCGIVELRNCEHNAYNINAIGVGECSLLILEFFEFSKSHSCSKVQKKEATKPRGQPLLKYPSWMWRNSAKKAFPLKWWLREFIGRK